MTTASLTSDWRRQRRRCFKASPTLGGRGRLTVPFEEFSPPGGWGGGGRGGVGARARPPPTSRVDFGRNATRWRQNAGIEALSVQSPCSAPPGPCLMVGLPDRTAPPVATGCDRAPHERDVESVESRAAAVLNVPRARLGYWCVRRDSRGWSSCLRHALSPPSDPAARRGPPACPARRSQRAARVEVPARRDAVGCEELRRARLCRLGFACRARHALETAPS